MAQQRPSVFGLLRYFLYMGIGGFLLLIIIVAIGSVVSGGPAPPAGATVPAGGLATPTATLLRIPTPQPPAAPPPRLTPTLLQIPTPQPSTPAPDQRTATPQATATSTPRPIPAPAAKIHVVQWGENLYRISLRYCTTMAELTRLNGLASDQVYAGQVLVVPDVPGCTH